MSTKNVVDAVAEDSFREKKSRRLPILSQIVFFPVGITCTCCHWVGSLLGIEPTLSMLITGGLFGLIIIPIAFTRWMLQIIDHLEEDYYHYFNEKVSTMYLKYFISPLVICYIVQILILDKTHLTVKDAGVHQSRFKYEDQAKRFLFAAINYFPVTCIPWTEKAALSPSKQYIFGVHPHGIHCVPLCIFAIEGSPFDKLFPGFVGYKITGLAATVMFKIPVVRELFLSMGYVDASRKTAQKVMDEGRSIFVCTGGEKESMLTQIGTDVVYIKERKGFVRLALSYGAELVPVFGVNVSDLYTTSSFLLKRRQWIQDKTGIALPIFCGRYLSWLPYKKPVKVLIGKPIATPIPEVRGDKPDYKLVDEYHQKYIDALIELHSKHVKDRNLRIE